MKALVSRRLPLPAFNAMLAALEQLGAAVDVWPEDRPMPRAELLARVRGMDGLYCLLTDGIDAELMDAAGPGLKVISQLAVGYDNVDVAAATARRIPLGNTPGVLTDTTADLAFALLMAAARRLGEGERYVRGGQWRMWTPNLLLGTDVTGATLGIVGFGRIGQALARRARGFGMRLLAYSRTRRPEEESALGVEFTSFESLLRQSDFVSLHTPLNAETRHLMGEAEFRLMKPTGILINTTRGPVVDQAALYRALKDGVIAYAGLDVTDPEPLPQADPLLTLDNVVVVPHVGSATVQTRDKMAALASDNLLAGLQGRRLPHCVNPQVYA